MKYHTQEHLVIKNEQGEMIQGGSCYPTVIACILDLEMNQVPYFHLLYWTVVGQKKNLATYFQKRYLGGKTFEQFEGEDYQKYNFQRAVSHCNNLWDDVKNMWLASVGYEELYIENIDEWLKDHPDIPYLVSGKSSRGVDHVVIYMNGQMIHDTHPSREGLLSLWEHPYNWLSPINQREDRPC